MSQPRKQNDAPGLSREEAQQLRAGVTHDVPPRGTIRVQLDPVSHVPIIALIGQVTGPEARQIMDGVHEKMSRIRGSLIIDLAACEYLPSEMIGFLTKFAFERHEAGQRLFLCAVPRRIEVTLALLNMDDFFHRRDSVEDAVAAAVISSAGS